MNSQCSLSSSIVSTFNYSTSKRNIDDGIGGCGVAFSSASTSSAVSSTSTDSGVDSAGRQREHLLFPINYQKPVHENFTCGLDVQNVNFPSNFFII